MDDPGRALAGLPGRKDARADEPANDDGVDRKLFGGLRQDQFAAFLTLTLAGIVSRMRTAVGGSWTARGPVLDSDEAKLLSLPRAGRMRRWSTIPGRVQRSKCSQIRVRSRDLVRNAG